MSASTPSPHLELPRRSRALPTLACLVAIGVLGGMHALFARTLAHPSTVSGWGLLAVCVALSTLGVRKRLSRVRALGSTAAWKATHLSLGVLACVLFALHLRRWPSGPLEVALFGLFVAVSSTGVFGVLLGWVAPRRLARRGDPVLFQRIPAQIDAQRAEVEALVFAELEEHGDRAAGELYTETLRVYFDGPAHAFAHLREDSRPVAAIVARLDPLRAELREALTKQVRRKADLDYHHAHQLLLRGWLLVHVPLAGSLLVVSLVHVLLVHAFGARP